MLSNRTRMSWATTALAMLLLLVPTPAAQAGRGRVRSATVPSAALAENTLGLPGALSLEIYLPPSYDRDPARRYPVLYLLHGIGGSSEDWTGRETTIQGLMDELISAARIPEFLVVMPTAKTPFGGSFYLNSPVNGGWEDCLVGDLIPFVDATFRTRAERAARGLAGHSMGGFGTLHLTLEHPDLFAYALALSPACLDVIEDLGAANPVWATLGDYRDLPALIGELQAGNMFPISMLALACAFSPEVGRAPFPVALPFRKGPGGIEPVPEVLARWQSVAIVPSLASRPDAYKDLELFYLDYGFADEFPHIPAGVEALHEVLVSRGVPHVVEGYVGRHHDELWERLETRVLPQFGAALAAKLGR